MKFLLTSGGIQNQSLRDALIGLLGKPISESTALFVPTAMHALPGGPFKAYQAITGSTRAPLCELGWKSVGVLELTALPTIKKQRWVPALKKIDALMVGGGDPVYLAYWMRQSGLAELLPSLPAQLVYLGLSAGSMVLTSHSGKSYGGVSLPSEDEKPLGLFDFSMYPHLEHELMPNNTLANAAQWAAKAKVPTYAIDDQTAVMVTDGAVEVVSEGTWKLFDGSSPRGPSSRGR